MSSIPRLIMDTEKPTLAPMVTIVPTTPSHIAALKMNLRAEDAAEILCFGASIQQALWRSYRNSLMRKTALIDGVVAACWGVCGTFLGQVGQPWLLTSPEVKRVSPLFFARTYQKEVIGMREMFPCLENFVAAEYDAAIRLLDITGFSIDEPEKKGNGMYRRFWIGG